MDAQREQNALNAKLASEKYSEAAAALEEAKQIEDQVRPDPLISGVQTIAQGILYIPYFFEKIRNPDATPPSENKPALETIWLFSAIFLSLLTELLRIVPTLIKQDQETQQAKTKPKNNTAPQKSTQTAIETITQYIPTPKPQQPVVAYSDSRAGQGMGFNINQNNQDKDQEDMKVNSVSFDFEALKAVAEPQEPQQPPVEYVEPQAVNIIYQEPHKAPTKTEYNNQKSVDRLAHDRKRYAWLKEQIKKGNIEKLSYKYLTDKLTAAGFKVSNQALKPILQDLVTDGLADATASGQIKLKGA